MTKALQDAFAAASRLPERDQDSLAAAILEEVALEERWASSLRATAGALEQLADEAIADHKANRAEPLDPDKL